MKAAVTAQASPPGVPHLANVRRILATILGVPPSDIAIDHGFEDRLGMDELDIFELAETIDRTYGVEIPDGEWAEISTVGDLCAQLALRNVAVIVP